MPPLATIPEMVPNSVRSQPQKINSQQDRLADVVFYPPSTSLGADRDGGI